MSENISASFKGSNGQIELYEDKVIIKRKGFGSFMSNLGSNISKGDKSIFLDQIRAIEITKGFVSGNIFFNIGDSGALGSHKDSSSRAETTVEYSSGNHKKAIEFKEQVESFMRQFKKGGSIQTPQAVSQADELKKFKELLDQGVITEEEFNKKKKELLGL